MALENTKNTDLWRWEAQKVSIYGVRKRKKCRFMALERAKSPDLWRWKVQKMSIYGVGIKLFTIFAVSKI